MENVITVDNGRFGSKMITDRLKRYFRDYKDIPDDMKDKLLIPAVVSPGRELRMDIDTDSPDRFWIEYAERSDFVGGLALDQGQIHQVNRTEDKTTAVDRSIMLCNLSLVADNGENLILLTNCPAKTWADREERKRIANWHVGKFTVKHRAGIKKGSTTSFAVEKAYVLPEGTGAFYSHVYDDDLNVVRPEYLDGYSLVLDIGDQTTDYLLFKDGEYQEGSCGSMDAGLYKAHAKMQHELEQKGVDLTLPEIADLIIRDKNIYYGKSMINAKFFAKKYYEESTLAIYNNLIGKFQMKKVRNVLLAGGGAEPSCSIFQLKFTDTNFETGKNGKGTWMNADGFRKMYKMMKDRR